MVSHIDVKSSRSNHSCLIFFIINRPQFHTVGLNDKQNILLQDFDSIKLWCYLTPFFRKLEVDSKDHHSTRDFIYVS